MCVVVTVHIVYTGCTHTFSSSDMNRAGDVGEALIHAHLQVDLPAKHKLVTDLILGHRCAHTPHTWAHICSHAHTLMALFLLLQKLARGVRCIPPSILSVLAAL